MSEEILKRIDALAAKLNTTAAQIWDVYVAQAKIEAIQTVIYALIVGVGVYVAIRFWRWMVATDNDNDGFFIAGGIATVLLAVAVVANVVAIGNLPTLLLNPQYWALHQVLEAIGK